MNHPRVEKIEKILEMADNFKHRSEQSNKNKKFERALKQEMEEEAPNKKDETKESYQDLLDRLFFEEKIKG